MKTMNHISIAFLLIVVASFTACVPRKKMAYFQQDGKILVPESNRYFSPKLRTDDLIGIFVTARDPQTALPFNPFPESINTQPPSYSNGVATRYGYLIDSEGMIDFPVLGRLKLAGLTRSEAATRIRNELSKYLQDPIVTLRILNFKITVLGDVRNPGTFTVPNERLSLPEALGLAGDLNMTGIRSNVLVIREEGEEKKTYRIDLTSNDLFSSPVYYLQQNDVIYVEPNQAQRNASAINNRAGVLISLASLIITTIILIVK